jgi:hypothetical protein
MTPQTVELFRTFPVLDRTAKRMQQERADALYFFPELPPGVQWRIAQSCDYGRPLLRVSRATRDLIVDHCSSIWLELGRDEEGDANRAAGFLRRVGQHGRDGKKLSITGLKHGSSLTTLLAPSLSAGGLSKVHDLKLPVGAHNCLLQKQWLCSIAAGLSMCRFMMCRQ